MRLKIQIALTIIWGILESYFVYRMYVDNSTGSKLACDYLGACMFFTPLFFTFLLFLIWKPNTRGWLKHIIFSIAMTVLVVVGVIVVPMIFLQFLK